MPKSHNWLAVGALLLAILLFSMYSVYHSAVVDYRTTRSHSEALASSPLCTDPHQRQATESVNGCARSERVVNGMRPEVLAILDAVTVLHPCGLRDERCARIKAAMAEIGWILWMLVLAILLSVIGVVSQVWMYTYRNQGRDLLPSGYGASTVDVDRPVLAWRS